MANPERKDYPETDNLQKNPNLTDQIAQSYDALPDSTKIKYHQALYEAIKKQKGEEAAVHFLKRVEKDIGIPARDLLTQEEEEFWVQKFKDLLLNDPEVQKIFFLVGPNREELADFLVLKYPEKFWDLYLTGYALYTVMDQYLTKSGKGSGGGHGGIEPPIDPITPRPGWQDLLKDQNTIRFLQETAAYRYLDCFKKGFAEGKKIMEAMIQKEENPELQNIMKQVIVYYELLDKNFCFADARDSLDGETPFPSMAARRAMEKIKNSKNQRTLVAYAPRTHKTSVGLLAPEVLADKGVKRTLHILPAVGIEGYLKEFQKYFLTNEKDREKAGLHKQITKRKILEIRNQEDLAKITPDITDVVISMDRMKKKMGEEGDKADEGGSNLSDLMMELRTKFPEDFMVVDEAHFFTGPSQRRAALLELINGKIRPKHLVLMTGTEFEKPDQSLFYVCALNPGKYPTIKEAEEAFRNKAQLIKLAINKNIIRCEAEKVYPKPPEEDQEFMVPMTLPQKAIYEFVQEMDVPNMQKIMLLNLVSQDPLLLKRKPQYRYHDVAREEIITTLKQALADFKKQKAQNPDLKFNNHFLVAGGYRAIFLSCFFNNGNGDGISDFVKKISAQGVDFADFLQCWEPEATLSAKYQRLLTEIQQDLDSKKQDPEQAPKVVVYSIFRKLVTEDAEELEVGSEEEDVEKAMLFSLKKLLEQEFGHEEVICIDGGDSTAPRSEKYFGGCSVRDEKREIWRYRQTPSILLTTEWASCVEVDLSVPGVKPETHDAYPHLIPAPGKAIHQHVIGSNYSHSVETQFLDRTKGPGQKGKVTTSRYLTGECDKKGEIVKAVSIDYGVQAIQEPKRIFVQLMRNAVPLPGRVWEQLGGKKSVAELTKYLKQLSPEKTREKRKGKTHKKMGEEL